MGKTSISWTEMTWNPTRGCTRVSEGCRNCYAERQAIRQSNPGGAYHGLVESTKSGPRWTGVVRLEPDQLDKPLRWRAPRRVFVDSMSDLFHEGLADEEIDRVFAVMALCPQHTFQVLTKRPKRMCEYVAGDRMGFIEHRARQIERESGRTIVPQGKTLAGTWPWPNVWLGTSVEDQHTADPRVAHLATVPAAVRFLSVEPLLGPVDLYLMTYDPGAGRPDWVIVGGESGPGARRCDVAWIRSVVEQCRSAEVACFVKQIGSHPIVSGTISTGPRRGQPTGPRRLSTIDRKGGDPSEWPLDLRVREFPETDPCP